MDQNKANPAMGSPGAGGAANTPPFDRAGRGDRPNETRTEREIERTRDMLAEAAAPVLAEKTQEAITETAHRLTEGPMGDEMKEQVRRTASAVREDATEALRERAGAAFGQVEERANEFLGQAATRLEEAARRVDEMADRQGAGRGGAQAKASEFAHGAADTMESVAGYLRDSDTRTLRRDLERQVRERPLQTLLIGVAAGWVVGKILR